MILDPQKIIINRREARSRGDVLLSFSLPLIFFGGLIYLAQPLAVGAWEHPEQFFILAGDYVPYILGGGFSLFAWAQYNRLRFGGGRDKRVVTSPPLSLEEIAAASPFQPDELRRLREAKEVRFFFDEQGEVVDFQRREEAASLRGEH